MLIVSFPCGDHQEAPLQRYWHVWEGGPRRSTSPLHLFLILSETRLKTPFNQERKFNFSVIRHFPGALCKCFSCGPLGESLGSLWAFLTGSSSVCVPGVLRLGPSSSHLENGSLFSFEMSSLLVKTWKKIGGQNLTIAQFGSKRNCRVVKNLGLVQRAQWAARPLGLSVH